MFAYVNDECAWWVNRQQLQPIIDAPMLPPLAPWVDAADAVVPQVIAPFVSKTQPNSLACTKTIGNMANQDILDTTAMANTRHKPHWLGMIFKSTQAEVWLLNLNKELVEVMLLKEIETKIKD